MLQMHMHELIFGILECDRMHQTIVPFVFMKCTISLKKLGDGIFMNEKQIHRMHHHHQVECSSKNVPKHFRMVSMFNVLVHWEMLYI